MNFNIDSDKKEKNSIKIINYQFIIKNNDRKNTPQKFL